MTRHCALALALLLIAPVARAADAPSREEAKAALLRAVHFYHKQVADHGGYVWRYSADLKLREGERITRGEGSTLSAFPASRSVMARRALVK